MRIAMIVGAYQGLSGVCTHVQDLCKFLGREGIGTVVFAPDVGTGSEGPTEFVRIPDLPGIPQPLCYYREVARRLKDIDIVHGHDSIAFVGAHQAAHRRATPTVFTFHGSIFSPNRALDYSHPVRVLLRYTNRYAARYADICIGVSQEMVRCAQLAGAESSQTILMPNLVDVDKFAPARTESVSQVAGGSEVLYVGGLRPVKGVHYLVEAMPAVREQIPEARLTIVGDGPEYARVAGLVKRLDLASAVELVGQVPLDRVAEYYARATVFVLPSLSDPRPLVVTEAFACGLPVIGTRVDGIPEMITDGKNGYLVSPGQPQEIAEAVVRILTNARLWAQLSQNALATAQELSWQRNIGKFVDLYQELTSAQAPARLIS